MGGNASPLIADLTLSHLEFVYYKNQPCRFNRGIRITRYIDDNLYINNEFDYENAVAIYGPDLPLEQTNQDHARCNYLDLDVNIGDGLKITVYDKTRDFDFNVIKFPHPGSNSHSKIIYGTVYSQILRYARICNNFEGFLTNTRTLCQIYLNRNCNKSLLLAKVFQFYENNKSILLRLNITSRQQFVDRIVIPIFGVI